jgi:hypothetical protein
MRKRVVKKVLRRLSAPPPVRCFAAPIWWPYRTGTVNRALAADERLARRAQR